MNIRKDITGLIVGRLTVIKPSHQIGHATYWACKCSCGSERAVQVSKLIAGETKSCGCLQRETAQKLATKHSLTNHPIWGLYRDIKNRCYRKNVSHYNLYGGRGVKMCDEWLNDFMSFYNWCVNNGWKRGLQIDKDIRALELGEEANLYSPERCQFVTPKQNSNARRNNRFITHNGRKMTLHQWSEEFGLNHATLFGRLKRGWPIQLALTISTIKTGKTKCSVLLHRHTETQSH